MSLPVIIRIIGQKDNTGAFYSPFPCFNGGSAIGQNQTRYLLNAAYCRLKSLSIGYTLPNEFTSKFLLKKLRVYFRGENLFTIPQITRKDPDPELMTL